MKYKEQFAKLLVLESDAERGDILSELTTNLEADELELITQKDLMESAVKDLEEEKKRYAALKDSYHKYIATNGTNDVVHVEDELDEDELSTINDDDTASLFSDFKF